MLPNPHSAFRGWSRSPNMVPFLLVCYSNFVEIFDFKKCRDLEIWIRGHSRSSELTRIDPPPMTSY